MSKTGRKAAVESLEPRVLLTAFPGAEGYGASATGGAGGAVIHVTNLNDTGTGSFRAAISTTGARTIVFDVGGTIVLQSSIILNGASYGNLTIAGQTAPGGIQLQGGALQFTNMSNIIIRHLSVRGVHNMPPGYNSGEDMISFYDSDHSGDTHTIILDHVSAACGEDETISGNGTYDVTVQWSSMEMACIDGQGGTRHPDSQPHNYGSLWGYQDTGGISFHHNLMGNMVKRNPEVDALQYADIRNNVVYNWSAEAVTLSKDYTLYPTLQNVNVMNNVYMEGPNGINRKHILYIPETQANIYFAGNKYVSYGGTVITNNDTLWNDSYMVTGHKVAPVVRVGSAIAMPSVTTQTADAAYTQVMAQAGAYPFDTTRRLLDQQILAKTGQAGILGPLEVLATRTDGPTRAATDTDRDGMPNAWETAHGLNPNNAADRNTTVPAGQSTGDRYLGYTYLNYYINEVADNLVPSPLPTYTITASAVKNTGGQASGQVVSTVGGWTPKWNSAYGNPVLTAWGSSQKYNQGSTVTMRAHPSTDLTVINSSQTPLTTMTTFDHWSGGPASINGSTNPVISFTADANYAIQAVFRDAAGPTVTSVTGPANGSYRAGQNLDFTVNYSTNVTVSGAPTIGLTIGSTARNATYLSGSGGTALVFRYTVLAGDTDTNGIASASPINLNGGTIKDAAGNNATLTFTAPTTTGVLVDTTAPAAPTVVINDGNIQRSMVRGLTVVFGEAVAISAGGLELRLQSGGAVANTTVTIANPSGDQKTYLLSFSGTAIIGGSLADGLYRLTGTGALIHDLAGNAGTDLSVAFHRYFGDSDGDRDVDGADSRAFRAALSTAVGSPAYRSWFDFDSDGDVDGADSRQFRLRLSTSI